MPCLLYASPQALVSHLAGVCARLLQVSCTDHIIIDHLVVESAGIAYSVADQLHLGI